MEGHSKLKIGRKEAHGTGDHMTHLEMERSKIKVTRPLNQPCLRNGKAYELQAACMDGAR